MKKTLMALAAAIAVAAAAATPALAMKDAEVWRGTPIIDGKLDDNYKKSYINHMDYENNAGWAFGTKVNDKDASINSYFLYDDDYFYIYHQVTDSNVTVPDDDTIISDPTKEYVCIDEVEVIIADVTGTRNLTKVFVDGNGKQVLISSMQAAGFPLEGVKLDKLPDYKKAAPKVKGYLDSKYGDMSAISPVKAAYTRTDVGYDVELAVPLTDDVKKAGFSLFVQLMDVDDPTGMTNGQSLQGDGGMTIKFSDKDAGNTPVAKASDDQKTSPSTADPTAMLALSAVSAGLAAFAANKLRKH